jgi:hypothetical protein
MKRFVSLQFLNPKIVGPWTGDQPVVRPLPTQNKTNRINSDIHALSEFRIHGPNVRESEEGSCLIRSGHCDRRPDTKLSLFADDTALFAKNYFPSFVRQNLQWHIISAAVVYKMGNSTNVDRTSVIPFTRTSHSPPELWLFSHWIPWSRKMKIVWNTADWKLLQNERGQ